MCYIHANWNITWVLHQPSTCDRGMKLLRLLFIAYRVSWTLGIFYKDLFIKSHDMYMKKLCSLQSLKWDPIQAYFIQLYKRQILNKTFEDRWVYAIKPRVIFTFMIFLSQLKLRRYRQVSNIRRTLVDNLTVDHSDVVVASPVGAAPTTSSFST